MPLYIIRQDITKMNCDAIVNTSNSEMVGYSGVDFAIHEKAGPQLDEECSKIAPLELGFAKLTKGYNLDCKYIIHTSGPIWQGGDYGEKALLKSCYMESLRLARQNQCRSVAFPLISSGVYGYPKDQVLKYAVQIISEFLQENEMTVYLCVYDKSSYEFSKELFNNIRNFIDNDEVVDDSIEVNYLAERKRKSRVQCCSDSMSIMPPKELNSAFGKSLNSYLKDMDKSFIETLFDFIDKKGMTDSECYNKANLDRRVFNKLKNNPHQKPKKQTAIALAIALELTFDETQYLLSTAGLTLSRSEVFDKIIRYFIKNGNYNIHEINEALFEFDQVLLGSF